MVRILIIDDEDLVQDTVGRILGSDGYEVQRSANGSEGIKRCSEEAFDVVITDLIMPGQEGVETIASLRRRHPRIKIIAMTGGSRVGHTDVLQLARKAGADRGIRKPFEPDDLLSAVRALVS